jgi:hypothetical protein
VTVCSSFRPAILNWTVVPAATVFFAGWKAKVCAFALPGPIWTTLPPALSAFLARFVTVRTWAAASRAARAIRFLAVSPDFRTTRTVPFMFGWTVHRTVKVPSLLNVTVNFEPLGIPELTVVLPFTTVPPDGAAAAGLIWMTGVTPPHQ